MIKTILSIFATVIAITSGAFASDITVLDYTRPNGLGQQINSQIANLPGFNSNMVVLGTNNDCGAVLNYLRNTDEPTVTSWFWFSNELGNVNQFCQNLDVDSLFVTAYAKTYINICSSNEENNIDFFRSGGFKFGYPSTYRVQASLLENLLGDLGIENVRFVPYDRVPDVMAALSVGEVSYGIFVTPNISFNCEISLDPTPQENSVSIYSFSEMEIAPRPIYINFVVIGSNVDQEFVRSSVEALTNSSEWNELFPGFYDPLIGMQRDEQLKILLDDLEYILRNGR